MSFTDQKTRVATDSDVRARWNGDEPGKRFRCYFCGYKFEAGDQWRFVYHKELRNFIVCETCDTSNNEELKDIWAEMDKEAKKRFWWLYS